MESFERGTAAQDYGEPLLYVMCALGARYASWIVFESLSSHTPLRTMFYDHRAANTQPDPFGGREEIAGGKWVDRARKEILVNTHAPSIQHLMVSYIFHVYFVLSANIFGFRRCCLSATTDSGKSRIRWFSP